MTLDCIDVQILDALQDNARISISELSKKVNLSLSAVSERLKKLESSGSIEKYTAIINHHEMGKELSVIMFISLSNTAPEIMEDLESFVNGKDDILECHHITGDFDFALMITTSTTDSLEQLLNEIKALPQVRRAQTNVILSTTKHKYSVKPVANR